jgi:4-amino-4-deoxy-L-arabinose transferase-like glycosyltransferase
VDDSGVASGRRRELLVVAALVLLAAGVRLPGLGYGLWVDEVATVLGFVRLPFAELLTRYPSPNHHVLNSALTRVSVLAFGETPWAVRLPSYLFGVATIPALYLLARAALTRAEAGAAALVLALSYHHAYFSQNARGYTGYLFFTVLGTLFLLRGLRGGRRRDWAGFAVAGAANVYVLLSGLFAVASQTLGALVLHVLPAPAEVRGKRLASLALWTGAAAVLTLLLYAPLLGDLIAFYTTAEGNLGWSWSAGLLGAILEAALPTRNPWLLGAGAVLGIPVLLAGGVRVSRRLPLAFFAFLLPPLLEFAVSALLGTGTYPRRFILVLPLAVLVGVSGVWSLARRATRLRSSDGLRTALFVSGVAAGALAVALPLPRLWSTPKQDFEGAFEWVASREAEGDEVVAAWVASGPARYLRPDALVARTPEELEAVLDGGRRVWLVTTFQRDMERFEPELMELVRNRFELRERFPGLVGGGTVLVWESRPDTGRAPMPIRPPWEELR